MKNFQILFITVAFLSLFTSCKMQEKIILIEKKSIENIPIKFEILEQSDSSMVRFFIPQSFFIQNNYSGYDLSRVHFSEDGDNSYGSKNFIHTAKDLNQTLKISDIKEQFRNNEPIDLQIYVSYRINLDEDSINKIMKLNNYSDSVKINKLYDLNLSKELQNNIQSKIPNLGYFQLVIFDIDENELMYRNIPIEL